MFENSGEATAREVEVYIEKIIDNGIERPEFLPVPLLWTHSGLTKRDFHPNQFGYLDFCRIDDINNQQIRPKLVLGPGAGVETYEKVEEGNTILSLVIFQESGDIIRYKIHIEYRQGFNWVKVKKIKPENVHADGRLGA